MIIVLTDQQRADAFGAAGAADLRTPVMDRLAREGVLFTRAFTATPQCSPSRAALMTGRYPHRTGVMGNSVEGRVGGQGPPPAGMSGPLDRSLPTLGRVFAAAGYETAYFGKWHLGGSPGDYGFQTHDSKVHDPTLASRVVAYLSKRAARETRPLLLIVSWLNPHDIYSVVDAPPPEARAQAAARLPSNLVDDLRDKPLPQRHYLEQDQGKPFVGADRTTWHALSRVLQRAGRNSRPGDRYRSWCARDRRCPSDHGLQHGPRRPRGRAWPSVQGTRDV